MSQPTQSQVHVNVPLTNISIAYLQDQKEFIADKVFPILPVQKQSDRYYIYERDAFFRSDAEERAPGAETPGTGFTLDNTPTYFARVYGIHQDIPDMVRENADSVLNPDADAAELVTRQLLIKRENIFINNYFGTGLWTGTLTGVAGTPGAGQVKQWDQAGSSPIEDVRLQALAMKGLTGYKPNVLVLGPYVTNGLLNNPEIIDRIKYVQKGFIDLDLLAQAFGVDRVVSAEAVQNTATEGAALSMGFMYTNSALLCYAPPRPGLRTPTAGYIFAWQGYLNGTTDVAVSRWYSQDRRSWRVEGEMAFDMKLIGADLGTFFTTVVS